MGCTNIAPSSGQSFQFQNRIEENFLFICGSDCRGEGALLEWDTLEGDPVPQGFGLSQALHSKSSHR